MDKIIALIEKITVIDIIDVLIAIAIIIFFKIFSSAFAYIIVRIFKIKVKNSKEIKESAFYSPLKVFFSILGVYLGVVFLKDTLGLNAEIMLLITKIFKIIVTLAFARGLAASFRINSTLVNNLRKKLSNKLDDSMFEFILKTIRAVIYIIAIFIVIALLGIDISALVAGLGIGGVIITLAAQDTAKNLLGGFLIFIDKPFIVGDWVQIDTFEGTVEDITFRSTRLRTSENSLVNIPNSLVSEASIINWSKLEKRRYKANLCIDFNTPLEKLERFQIRVKEMLKDKEDIFDDSIIVRFDNITSNGINIYICSYTNSVDYMSYLKEKERINYKIMQILDEENIKLAYDSKNIYIKNSI